MARIPPFTTFSQQVINTPTSPMFGTQASTSTRPPPASQIPFPPFSREYTLGMPSSLMEGINTQSSVYADNAVAVHSPFNPYLGSGSAINSNLRQNQPQVGLGFNQQSFLPPIPDNSIQVLRQTMDESNHDMVNTLTQQIGDVFNPLINNTDNTYQLLAQQMGRIADFFGTPPPPNHLVPLVQPAGVQPNMGIQNQGIPVNNPVQQPQMVQQPIQQAAQAPVEGNAG